MKNFLSLLTLLLTFTAFGADYKVCSPDGRVCACISTGEVLSYSVYSDGTKIIEYPELALKLSDGVVYGGKAGVLKTSRKSGGNTEEAFNEMALSFKSFKLIVRVYNDAAAYRFASLSRKGFTVLSEDAGIDVLGHERMWVNYIREKRDSLHGQFNSSHENTYSAVSVKDWNPARLAITPLVIEKAGGLRVTVCESDLLNYPGLYYNIPEGGDKLVAHLPGVPATLLETGTSSTAGIIQRVASTHPYIAQCGPCELFPWRITGIAHSDSELLEQRLVERFASKADNRDWSWVKPGMCAWDWWSDSCLSGVDFEAGINTATYKYYIDFASRYDIPYVVIDAGWSVPGAADLMKVVPKVDLAALVKYGNDRNVGLILWAGYWTFHRDMQAVCEHYSAMGLKGFKVDFHERDDQKMIAYYREAAEMTARYHLLLDLHGCSKPTGLNITFPNVVSFEAVYGLEQAKFKGSLSEDMVVNELVIPFTRMQAGPVDYTSGAMRNATRKNFNACFSEPMSQGTRARQVAHFVVLRTPLPMLCDSPSAYLRESEVTEFISAIPTVWEESRALENCRIGEYAAVARRSGRNCWYVAAMNDWNECDKVLDLSFLDAGAEYGVGEWVVEVIEDGANAGIIASDFRHRTFNLPADKQLHIHLAPGGGFTARLVRR